MSIQDLGALGEFLGFIAVLVTLVYLSLQTRQARVAAEESAKFAGLQATHSIIDLYADWRRTLLSNPEHPIIIAKANAGESLSESEKIVVSLIFHDLFFGASYSFTSADSSGSIHDAPADVEYTVMMINKMPCGRDEWELMKHNVAKMSPEFVELVDSELQTTINV